MSTRTREAISKIQGYLAEAPTLTKNELVDFIQNELTPLKDELCQQDIYTKLWALAQTEIRDKLPRMPKYETASPECYSTGKTLKALGVTPSQKSMKHLENLANSNKLALEAFKDFLEKETSGELQNIKPPTINDRRFTALDLALIARQYG